jgi:hypothetical protein
MDGTTKWLNSLSIVGSVLLGIGVGSYAYRLMAGYAATGHVALADEEDLDRFLEEEELERQEEAQHVAARTRSRSASSSSSIGSSDADATPLSEFPRGDRRAASGL